jgi:hypothetical protein
MRGHFRRGSFLFIRFAPEIIAVGVQKLFQRQRMVGYYDCTDMSDSESLLPSLQVVLLGHVRQLGLLCAFLSSFE